MARILNTDKTNSSFKENNYIAFTLLYLIISIQLFLFTSFVEFFPYEATLLYRIINILIIIFVFYGVIVQLTIRKLVYVTIILSISLFTLWKLHTISPYIKLLLLSIAVPATIPSAKKIVKISTFSLVTVMILTVTMSFFGFLPKSGTASKSFFSHYQETVYFLGFNHPNGFGTILAMIYVLLMFLYFEKHKWIMSIFSVMVFVTDILAGAGTAAVSVLLVFSITILPVKFYGKAARFIYTLPIGVAAFSIWLSYYNNGGLGSLINEKIASRPNVWNAYISQYPIKWVSDPIQVNTSGYLGILGNGVLDGSYIYVLIYWGISALIVYIIDFMVLLKFSVDLKNRVLFSIAIMTIITAFPESHMIMFYENIFLIFIGFYQYSSEEREKYLQS